MITARLGKDDVSPDGKVPSGLLHAGAAQTDSVRLPAASCGEDGDLSHRRPRPRACSHGAESAAPERTQALGTGIHRAPRQGTGKRNREKNIHRLLGTRPAEGKVTVPPQPCWPLGGPEWCWMRTARATRGPRWPRSPGTATRPGTQREPPGREGGRKEGEKMQWGAPVPRHRTAPTPSTAAARLARVARLSTSAPPPVARRDTESLPGSAERPQRRQDYNSRRAERRGQGRHLPLLPAPPLWGLLGGVGGRLPSAGDILRAGERGEAVPRGGTTAPRAHRGADISQPVRSRARGSVP